MSAHICFFIEVLFSMCRKRQPMSVHICFLIEVLFSRRQKFEKQWSDVVVVDCQMALGLAGPESKLI